MRQGVGADNFEKVGAVMTENHNLLMDMGLSHETRDLLCPTAFENIVGTTIVYQMLCSMQYGSKS